jgi:hypothetical protein
MIVALKSIVNYETMGSRRKKFKGLVLSKFVSMPQQITKSIKV